VELIVRELITENDIINENWMLTVSANADGRMSFQKIEIRGSGFLCVWIRPDGSAMVSFQGALGALGPHCARAGVGDTFLYETELYNTC
jgi:hypothetical protein